MRRRFNGEGGPFGTGARALGLQLPSHDETSSGSTLVGSGAMLLGAPHPPLRRVLHLGGTATPASATTAARTETSRPSSMRLTGFAMGFTRRKSHPRRRSMRFTTSLLLAEASPASSPPMSFARRVPGGGAWFSRTIPCSGGKPSRTRCLSTASCSRARRAPTTRWYRERTTPTRMSWSSGTRSGCLDLTILSLPAAWPPS